MAMNDSKPPDERAPSSEPTPKKPAHLSSPRIIDLPPSGQGFVIGGVSGFQRSKTLPDSDEEREQKDEEPDNEQAPQ